MNHFGESSFSSISQCFPKCLWVAIRRGITANGANKWCICYLSFARVLPAAYVRFVIFNRLIKLSLFKFHLWASAIEAWFKFNGRTVGVVCRPNQWVSPSKQVNPHSTIARPGLAPKDLVVPWNAAEADTPSALNFSAVATTFPSPAVGTFVPFVCNQPFSINYGVGCPRRGGTACLGFNATKIILNRSADFVNFWVNSGRCWSH